MFQNMLVQLYAMSHQPCTKKQMHASPKVMVTFNLDIIVTVIFNTNKTTVLNEFLINLYNTK